MIKNNSVNDLKKIKDKYGEEMMHLCCELFATILEEPGLLFHLLEENFAYSKLLYDDIVNNNLKLEFKDYMYGLLNVENKKIVTFKTPEELLKEVGYTLYECHNEEEIQNFKKYYAKNEELCTFDGGRLKRCYVFFAVRENVDDIKRDDFVNPKREDEYGTSVISIQFSRGDKNTLSIKNRYNHHVNNSDATFSNNLENIIPGLTYAFEKKYKLNIKQNNTFHHFLTHYKYVKANDGKYYKYNYEINNIYYCPNNIIIDDFEVIRNYEKKYIVMDYFVIDLRKKKIKFYDYNIQDSFVDGLQDISKIKVIRQKESGNKVIIIKTKKGSNITIEIDKQNRIISYQNDNLKQVGNRFLYNNIVMQELNLPSLEEVGDDFLGCNEEMKKLKLLRLRQVGDHFLLCNQVIQEINLPSLEKVGADFLGCNRETKKLMLPRLKQVGEYFLYCNRKMQELILPNLEEVGDGFLFYNEDVKKLMLPRLKQVGADFLFCNREIQEIDLPGLEKVGDGFLFNNKEMKKLKLSGLKQVGDYFLYGNQTIREIDLPSLEEVGNAFLADNQEIQELDLSNLEKVGDGFLEFNHVMQRLKLQNLKQVGDGFLFCNREMQELILPNLEEIGDDFLCRNKVLQELILLSLQQVGDNFLESNREMQELILPSLEKVGDSFLFHNKIIQKLFLQNLKKIGNNFLYHNEIMQELNLPILEQVGNHFLENNDEISKINMPKLKTSEISVLRKIKKRI